MTTADLTPVVVEPKPLPPEVARPEPIKHGYELPVMKGYGKPTTTTEYHAADGSIAFLVCRWDATPKKPKLFAPVTMVDGELAFKGYPAPRPILNVPSLLAAPTAPVLVVEGEKCAVAAAKYVPEGWIITTWASGAASVKLNDWSPLRERRCVIWPDNDEAGMQAAIQLSNILNDLRAPNAIVILPTGLPEGWDLGDPLPNNASADGVTRILMRTLDQAALPEPPVHYRNGHQVNGEILPPEPSQPPPVHEILVPEGTVGAYVALGTDPGNDNYFFFSTEAKRLIKLARREISTSEGILSLHADYSWWRDTFLSGTRSKDGLEAFQARETKHIGNYLRSACHRQGIFNENRIRSRGVFIDKEHVITHVGHEVWVDGHVVDPSTITTSYVYPLTEQIMPIANVKPLTGDDGKLIVDVAHGLRWEKAVYADLLLGLIATAPICGALRWKTHGIITGPKGAGKSWVLEEFVGKCLGSFAIKALGESTAAGIRSRLRHERLPVTFDEAESASGPNGGLRMDQLIELMRAASKATDAVVLKGSSNHSGQSFSLNTMFILGCIGIPISKPADLSRTVVLTLRGAQAEDGHERKRLATHFAELTDKLSRLPDHVAEKLLRRMSRLAPIVQKNADTFRDVIASQHADSRTGDQLGVLFAGRYNLEYEGLIPKDRAAQMLHGIDWSMFTHGPSSREDLMLLAHMASEIVRVDAPQGLSLHRTIGELIAYASRIAVDPRLPCEDAKDNLQRYGLRSVMGQGDVPGFIMHATHPFLDKVFSRSDYPKGYYDIIARNPGVVRSQAMANKSLSIGQAGNKRPYIWIPADLVCSQVDGVE